MHYLFSRIFHHINYPFCGSLVSELLLRWRFRFFHNAGSPNPSCLGSPIRTNLNPECRDWWSDFEIFQSDQKKNKHETCFFRANLRCPAKKNLSWLVDNPIDTKRFQKTKGLKYPSKIDLESSSLLLRILPKSDLNIPIKCV